MHNLEHLMAEWRNNTMALPGMQPEALDELENHVRETAEALVRTGLTEAEAFHRAIEQLGSAPAIASEFQKLHPPTWWPVKAVIGTGLMASLALVILLIARFEPGRSSFLLASHVFTVTLGYSATFLIGALGICFVGQRCLSDFSPLRVRSLTRVTFILGCIAAGLTAVGVILAMVWAKAEWGRYWAWDVKEVGGLGTIVWLACFLFVHRFASARGVLVMSILGNVVVSLAWFGAHLLSGLHSYGTSKYWLLLLAAIGCHVALFLAGLAPAGWLRPRKG